MTNRPRIVLAVPAKAEYLVLARLALAGLAPAAAIDEETAADLKLAVTEACSNAVRHAYAAGSPGSIRVTYELRRDAVVIDVDDDGRGFDPDRAERRADGPHDGGLPEGGMGLAIIEALVDELELGARPDGPGMRVRMLKRLVPAGTRAT